MLNTRQNFHHSNLPRLGAIGYLVAGTDGYRGPQFLHGERTKYRVVSFPVCDNVLPWSKGIHTVHVQRLRDNRMFRVSGFYFTDPEDL